MADYRDLAAALGGGYGQDTGGITPDTLITLKNGKTASAGDLLGMLKGFGQAVGSNLESLGRGGVASVIGAGGDLESLGRMGINKLYGAGGVNVNPTPVLPTTTDILGMIPRATAPRQETAGMEELGGYMTPATAKMAGKAIKATEGLPVGMGIKDVGQSAITREGNPIQGAVVLVGDKIFMGKTHGDALNRAIYEGVVRKEGGKYIYPKGAEVNSDLFMTKDGQIIDRLQASRMFDVGASETAIEKGLMQNNPPKSMTVDSYIEQATALKKQREQSPYPQQAALDLAQQRAALPVEPSQNASLLGQTKPKDESIRIYRGSFETNPEYSVLENYPNAVYNGVFGSSNLQSAQAHGSGAIHFTDIPKNKIVTHYELNYEIPYEKTKNALLKERPDLKNNSELFDELYDIVVGDAGQNLRNLDDNKIRDLFRTSPNEANNEAQRLRGQVAKNLGYKAIEMTDEHGAGTYLVTPGAKFKSIK